MKSAVKKRIFAAVFTAGLLSFSGYNLYLNGERLSKQLEKICAEKDYSTSETEEVMLENIPFKIELVEVYGLVQRMLLKDDYNDFEYIKDKKGFLNYAQFYSESDKDIFEYAKRVKALKDYASQYGTEVLFVITPSKYDRENSDFLSGMPINDPEEDVNELMVYLNRMGVETLNLGEYFPLSELTYEESFFKTDHHWTVPASFFATKIIVEELNNRFDAGLDPDGYYLSEDTFEYKTYRGHMLGAMGRDTDVMYSGLEDFTAMFPRYEGDFVRTYIATDREYRTKEGTYSEAFLDYTVLEDDVDYYVDSQYSLYLDQIRDIEIIENRENPDGKSIFMIRDSYFGPVITFMAPLCSRIDAVYSMLRSNDMTITGYLKERFESGVHYDYVIVEIYPYNIYDEAFRFFRG